MCTYTVYAVLYSTHIFKSIEKNNGTLERCFLLAIFSILCEDEVVIPEKKSLTLCFISVLTRLRSFAMRFIQREKCLPINTDFPLVTKKKRKKAPGSCSDTFGERESGAELPTGATNVFNPCNVFHLCSVQLLQSSDELEDFYNLFVVVVFLLLPHQR